MHRLHPTYKQLLFFLLKLGIVFGAFYFIYSKVVHNKTLSFNEFILQLETVFKGNYSALFILIGLTLLNWSFEILKWKTLVSVIKKFSFLEATKQSLGSLTASLFTPNRIGEYGAKAIYFNKPQRKKVLLLNLISNASQMAITVAFGIAGLLFVFMHFDINVPILRTRKLVYIFLFIVSLFLGGRYFIPKKIRGFYFSKIVDFIKRLPRILVVKVLLFAVLKYLVFSHQFYYLLLLFGIEGNYSTLLLLIFAMYLIASIIPGLPLFDWLIKGSVAVYIFGFVGANELVIVAITLIMWLLNFALPSVIGSYFVLNFSVNSNYDK